MTDYFIFVQNNIREANILEERMFKDILSDKKQLTIVKENSIGLVSNILGRRKVQTFTQGKLNFLFIEKYNLYKEIYKINNKYKKIYVIFLNTTFTTSRYPLRFLEMLKQQFNNLRYIMFYIDSASRDVSKYANYLLHNKIFDLTYTFDSDDAVKNNLIFWQTPYSKLLDKRFDINKDLYFAGVESNRGEILKKIIEISKTFNVNVTMDVIVDPNNSVLKDKDYNVNLHSKEDIMEYDEIISKTLEANCILDIVRSKQVGLTLRAYEAIVYNKKLLTNNPSILKLSFYNEKYIQYFKDVNDINWNWVREKSMVNYNYQNEFSPINLLNDIRKRLD